MPISYGAPAIKHPVLWEATKQTCGVSLLFFAVVVGNESLYESVCYLHSNVCVCVYIYVYKYVFRRIQWIFAF